MCGQSGTKATSNLNLTDSSAAFRLLTLCILYVAQGIPFGFVTITFAAYLVHFGEKMNSRSVH